MHAKIIPIGTSRGIRIPKYLLDKYQLNTEVSIEETSVGILIKPIKKARTGWLDAGIKLSKIKQNSIIPMPSSDWDKDEWTW
jgi:antitoxin MazE